MSKNRKGAVLTLLISVLVFALVASQGISQQKPIIAKGCSLPGCHTAKTGELWGNVKTVSGKAEMIQIDTGTLWTVKFNENTKQPINKLPKEKEIAITYVEKNGELYATLINVKPPVAVDPAKVIKVSEMKKKSMMKKRLSS